MNTKEILLEYPFIKNTASRIFWLLGRNRVKIKGRNNVIVHSGAFLRRCSIAINGSNNLIIISGNGITRLHDCKIKITGNNNVLRIGDSVSTSICVNMEDDGNQIILGDHFTGGGNSELAAIEGTSIVFGQNCLLSTNIRVSTGDSHSITDLYGKRTNRSRSVIIGEHCWIGNTVLIFKGTTIGANSMVGGGSVVPGKDFPENSLIAGNPATIVRNGVNWKYERIPVE
jgi:acetyltransferase-like isoleucine patch superfamily enzyme